MDIPHTIVDDLRGEIDSVTEKHSLLQIKSKYLGSKSILKNLQMKISSLSPEKRRIFGKTLSETTDLVKNIIEEKILSLEKALDMSEDVTLEIKRELGYRNILSTEKRKVIKILERMNFQFEFAPEIDTEFYNFTSLNIPEYHPCRTDHQSFFLSNGLILRTHCTNIQNRILQKSKNCRIATIGRVFRKDADRTHSPMFHQIEFFVINESANLQNLLRTLRTFLNEFFERKMEIRIRSSYFPFTEPSLEIDIFWNEKWLEVLGCGIIHENVFKHASQSFRLGFAAGCGLERLIMIKYNIPDIRFLYNNNINYVKQYGERI